MTEMVERVARAMFESDTKWVPIFEHQFEENRQMYFAAAFAAIEAMREPTQKMLESGLMAGTNLTTGQPSARLAARPAGERMSDQWQAMIDAALPPPPSCELTER